MSGGCEWPRHVLSDAEHAGLHKDLAARGLLDVPAPDWVRTRNDYQDWRFSRRWRCTVDAVVACRREGERLDNSLAEVRRAGAGPAELEAIELEKRRLHDAQTWARAFDERTDGASF